MSLFGGMPFPVQFFLAFIVVLGLIGVAAWLVRRLGAGRLGGVGVRGRQPRLAVVDYANVDGRRRLILVRRDNVEHLVMIGGPSDVVVEGNIIRATPAPREVPVARSTATVELPPPRAIPVPEPAAHAPWPLQPEPAVAPAAPRMPRSEPVPEEPAAWPLQPQAEMPPRPPRDTLAALADELSTRPAVPLRPRPQTNSRPQPPEPRAEPRQEARQETRQEQRQQEPRQEARQDQRQEPRQEPRQESRPEQRPEPRQEPAPEPRVAAAPPANSEAAAAADRSLAEMAQQLEAALRKPAAKTERSEPRAPAVPRAATPGDQTPAAPAAAAPTPNGAPPRNARTPDVKPASRPDAKQAPTGKALYDSLEQEMASLLGRPTAKN